MTISAIYILDKKGNILINRAYRSDLPFEAHEKFLTKRLSQKETTNSPVLIDSTNNCTYIYQTHENLVCKQNVDKGYKYREG